jgi:hypothetical protein
VRKPFGTKQMIDGMMGRLTAHSMLPPAACCAGCRCAPIAG